MEQLREAVDLVVGIGAEVAEMVRHSRCVKTGRRQGGRSL
jgi:hypothetical protein